MNGRKSISTVAASVIVVLIIVGAILAGAIFSKHSTTTQNTISSLTSSSEMEISSATSTMNQAQKGITFTPSSYDSSGIQDFLNKIPQLGNTISWAGDWEELGLTDGAPANLAQIAESSNLTIVIEAQFFSQPSGQLLRPLDNATIANYTQMAVSFARTYHPAFMAFGIEVNILYEKSPSSFDSFVSLYNQVYDEVKSASPSTTVFTIFQLERMAGMQGGLYGVSNNASAEWSLLGKFKMDAVGFTTYPDLVFKNPADIPLNFYSQIKNYSSLPVIFTEVGWHSAAAPAGWESSPQEQAQFVSTFFSLTVSLDKVLEIWSFLYDQNAPVPFNSMGLLNSNGTARPAWNAWING